MKTRWPFPPVPMETAREATTIFNKSNKYLCLGENLDTLLEGINLGELTLDKRDQTNAATRLGLITIFQIEEGLLDSQSAEAVQARSDWKYALHLPKSHLGFSPEALCEFRQVLFHNPNSLKVFQTLLDRLVEVGFISNNKRLGDPIPSLELICLANRVAWIAEAIGNAIEALAVNDPEWLLNIALPHWYERYNNKRSNFLHAETIGELVNIGQGIGRDADYLLRTIKENNNPVLVQMPEVIRLQQELSQYFQPGWQDSIGESPRCTTCG